MRVATPCVGLDAGSRSAWALRAPWQPVAVYDVEANIHSNLDFLYCDKAEQTKHLGAVAGDITNISTEEAVGNIGDVHGLLSGPPCPPVSSIGARKTFSDSRTTVMARVLDWIEWLVQKDIRLEKITNPTFAWFVIENPDGILKRKRGQETSLGEAIISDPILTISPN